MKMKMYDRNALHEMMEAEREAEEKRATDPKHLKSGLVLRQEINSQEGYGKNERIEKPE